MLAALLILTCRHSLISLTRGQLFKLVPDALVFQTLSLWMERGLLHCVLSTIQIQQISLLIQATNPE